MNKFTNEDKFQAVHRYLDETISYRHLAKEIGVDNSALRYWVKLYEYHGDQAFAHPYTNYSSEFKLKVITCIEDEGYSIREASALFHIPDYSMVRRWMRKWKNGGMGALASKRKGNVPMPNNKKTKKTFKSVEEELEYLRMENAYLKKLNGLSRRRGPADKRQKAQIIFGLRHDFPVKQMVEVAGLSRSTYYHQMNQMSKPDPDRDLKEKIKAIFHREDGTYGYRRIQNELENNGRPVNHKKVYRLMKELGLRYLVRMKKYSSYKGRVGKVAENILNRNFKAEKPNQKWVTDITEFKLFGQKLYLSPILDLFNGEIITYTLGTRPTYNLVGEMLEKGLVRLEDTDELLIHSDQGWHYQMKQYRDRLQKAGITQSMSRKGNCHDNAVIENFFGLMKSEFLYHKDFESIEHFKQELSAFMEKYNNRRIKSKLRMSPVQFRDKYQATA
ncbi:IS3 family transposase [Halobacillus sp. HZG1]|nr:IS3 family transposase [Halobacillus sp. HZG1]MEC3883508.1 IS3 family transposase [Halobacillus sp. HZG1]